MNFLFFKYSCTRSCIGDKTQRGDHRKELSEISLEGLQLLPEKDFVMIMSSGITKSLSIVSVICKLRVKCAYPVVQL